MSIIFLNNALVPFLLLMAVPLVLHLFARSKPPVYKFPSLAFIDEAIRSTHQVKRPQELVLLIIRTILIAAAILVFLKPLIFSKGELAGLMESRNVVVIVDRTASMAYSNGAQTRFSAACAEASSILAGLSSHDKVNVLWLDREPDLVFPKIGNNLRFLQDALRKGEVSCESGDIEGALLIAENQLSEATGHREICLISDFQRNAYENVNLNVGLGIDLMAIHVGRGETLNSALVDLQYSPICPLVNEEITVTCTVSNFSSEPQRRIVYISQGETRQSRSINIEPWSTMQTVFFLSSPVAGDKLLTATLDDDVFPDDNVRYSVLAIRENLSVAILNGETKAGKIFRQVCKALQWANVTSISSLGLTGDLPYDILLLIDWDGSGVESLAKALSKGKTVVILPEENLPLNIVSQLASSPQYKGKFTLEALKSPLGLKVENPDSQLLEIFSNGAFGDPVATSFKMRMNGGTNLLPGSDIILSYSDDLPALVHWQNTGHCYLWAMSLGAPASTMHVMPEFVSLIGELLLTSRVSAETLTEFPYSEPGDYLYWHSSGEFDLSNISLVNQTTGETLKTVEERHESGVSFRSLTRPAMGPYSWFMDGKPSGIGIINFPKTESDLRSLQENEVETRCVSIDNGGTIRSLRNGVSVWPQLILVCFLAAIVEGGILLAGKGGKR
jgi:hypothetical protein